MGVSHRVPDPRVGNLQIDGCMHPSKENTVVKDGKKNEKRDEKKKTNCRYRTAQYSRTVQYRTVLRYKVN